MIESGLICQHCGGPAVPFDELPPSVQSTLRKWAEQYLQIHDVAH